MMTNDLFLKASRIKTRFESAKGKLSVEELWDLPLTSKTGPNLDDIARGLHRSIKQDDSVSFVNRASDANTETQFKFDLVKYVIDTRLSENEEAAKKKANSEKKQQLLGLISQKENETLAGKPLEELRKMVAEL